MTNQLVSDFIKQTAYDQVMKKIPKDIPLPVNATVGV